MALTRVILTVRRSTCKGEDLDPAPELRPLWSLRRVQGGYAAAGTSPGSGGPSGSFTSRARVVS